MTNDADIAKRMRLLRSHGISSATEDMHPRSDLEIWNYQQIDLGFNYRMTEIQAALGLSQMSRLNEFVAKRNELASRYDRLLTNLPVTILSRSLDGYSSHHLYPIRLKLEQVPKTHREVYEALRKSGILVNLHYIPIYLQPYYEQMGFKRGYCLEAERYYSEVISIPLYPGLTEAQQDRVIEAIRQATAK